MKRIIDKDLSNLFKQQGGLLGRRMMVKGGQCFRGSRFFEKGWKLRGVFFDKCKNGLWTEEGGEGPKHSALAGTRRSSERTTARVPAGVKCQSLVEGKTGQKIEVDFQSKGPGVSFKISQQKWEKERCQKRLGRGTSRVV